MRWLGPDALAVARPSRVYLLIFFCYSVQFNEIVGAWCFGCCQGLQGLPVGFLLLQYSILCIIDLSCFSVLCLVCLCALLVICALWSSTGKGLTSWFSFVVSYCEFVIFPLVSWVRCGT